MTVKELIDYLKDFPMDQEVVLRGEDEVSSLDYEYEPAVVLEYIEGLESPKSKLKWKG